MSFAELEAMCDRRVSVHTGATKITIELRSPEGISAVTLEPCEAGELIYALTEACGKFCALCERRKCVCSKLPK